MLEDKVRVTFTTVYKADLVITAQSHSFTLQL